MSKLGNLLSRWPLMQQFKADDWRATGDIAWSEQTRTMRPRNEGAEVTKSICPYCAVGCGQLVFHHGNKLVSIEGDPASPHSRGHLCPKGADTYELCTSDKRFYKVKYRAPHAKEWTEIPLDQAMEMVAQRTWETRLRTFHARARQQYPGHRPSRRRHPRQRRELSDQEAFHRRPGHRLRQQSGPYMT